MTYDEDVLGKRPAGWMAWHERCGWTEVLIYWHNAFWAADHHMRYDCGRRSPSSGTCQEWRYACPDEGGMGITPTTLSLTVRTQVYHQPMSTEEYQRKVEEGAALGAYLDGVGLHEGWGTGDQGQGHGG